ncbi:hypothetical protein ACTQ49_02695 [Luteococcus sp. Sow4_B9]|uniref:hypothetical protein n=1 Tax=Luteococcus sp. Sow4_B9 TaxID=3438792 RepID=UPI003F96986C
MAAVGGAVLFAWYAMPDVVRSRTARGVLKSGLLAGAGVLGARLTEGIEEEKEMPQLGKLSPAVVAGGLALLGGSTWLTVVIEKKIFARGERRRSAGVTAAHSRMAVGLAALGAAAALLPD